MRLGKVLFLPALFAGLTLFTLAIAGCGGGTGMPAACRAETQACAVAADCCNPLLCSNGSCSKHACAPAATACTATADCCNGLACTAGMCAGDA